MDGHGLIQSMAAQLNMPATTYYAPLPPDHTPQHLIPPSAPIPSVSPPSGRNLDPQAAAIANARLEMVNQILIQHLMQVAGIPVPPPLPNHQSTKTVAPPSIMAAGSGNGRTMANSSNSGGSGGGGGGNTVAPPSIMRQQARRERELQKQQQQHQEQQEPEPIKDVHEPQPFHKPFTDEDRNAIIARLTDAIVQWFLNHYNITENDVDAVPKAAVWDKARMHLPLELGKRVFFNQLMKGLKMMGKRIRIKNSMVMRVKMKEHLKPIAEEDCPVEEDEDEEVDDGIKSEFNESIASQMDLELKRCLGIITDDDPQDSKRRNSVDAQVQADIGEEPLGEVLVPHKAVARTKAAMTKSSSVSSTDGASLSHIPWHQITSTPALLQPSHLYDDLTPIMAANKKLLPLKTRRTGSLERRPSRTGSTGSMQGRPRPQRPPRKFSDRASRSSRPSRTRSISHPPIDNAHDADTSLDDHTSSGVFSNGEQANLGESTLSVSDSEIARHSRDYGTHNIAQFLSSLQSPDTPRSKSTSRSMRYRDIEMLDQIQEKKEVEEMQIEEEKQPKENNVKPAAQDVEKSVVSDVDGMARKSLVNVQDFQSRLAVLWECLRNVKTSMDGRSWDIEQMQLLSMPNGNRFAYKCKPAMKPTSEQTPHNLGPEEECNLTFDLFSLLDDASADDGVCITVYQEGVCWSPCAIFTLSEATKPIPQDRDASPQPPEPASKMIEGLDEVDVNNNAEMKDSMEAVQRAVILNFSAACQIPLPPSDCETIESEEEQEEEDHKKDIELKSAEAMKQEAEVSKPEDLTDGICSSVIMKEEKMEEGPQGIDVNIVGSEKADVAGALLVAGIAGAILGAGIKGAEELMGVSAKGDDEGGSEESHDKKGWKKVVDEVLAGRKEEEEDSVDGISSTIEGKKTDVDSAIDEEDGQCALKSWNIPKEDMLEMKEINNNSVNTGEAGEVSDGCYMDLEVEIVSQLLNDMIQALLSFEAMHGYWEKLGDGSVSDEIHSPGKFVIKSEIGDTAEGQSVDLQNITASSDLWNLAINGGEEASAKNLSQGSDLYNSMDEASGVVAHIQMEQQGCVIALEGQKEVKTEADEVFS